MSKPGEVVEVKPEDILTTWWNAQVELFTAAANALENTLIAVHRAEVRVKMKNKRPKLRRSTRVTQPLRRYVRNNPDMKWLLP